jgi:DNA-directed RNA polymerase specialized sigma24 family protein
LKKNVDTFLIDQLGRKTFLLISDDSNEDSEEGESIIGFRAAPDKKEIHEFLVPEEIDEFWVLGETCAEPFTSLSVQERQLLKWRYVDGLRSSEISKKISEHPNTIREHISKTKDKIIKTVVESNMQDVISFLDLESS